MNRSQHTLGSHLVMSNGECIPGHTTATGMACDVDWHRQRGHTFACIKTDSARFVAIDHIIRIEQGPPPTTGHES